MNARSLKLERWKRAYPWLVKYLGLPYTAEKKSGPLRTALPLEGVDEETEVRLRSRL